MLSIDVPLMAGGGVYGLGAGGSAPKRAAVNRRKSLRWDSLEPNFWPWQCLLEETGIKTNNLEKPSWVRPRRCNWHVARQQQNRHIIKPADEYAAIPSPPGALNWGAGRADRRQVTGAVAATGEKTKARMKLPYRRTQWCRNGTNQWTVVVTTSALS
jgi:hypothetical protein